MMAGSGVTQSIYERVNTAYDGITRAELIQSLGLTADQVRCRTNDLVRQGRIDVKTDEKLGVTRYYPASEPPAATYAPSETSANNKEFNYGFAQGYALGLKESQRQAYEEGKAAVFEKLRAILT